MHIGENGHGKYFLYSVQDESGQEYAWFAPHESHEVIQTAGLKQGSAFLVQRVESGRKGSSKIEVSILATPEPSPKGEEALSLKAIMLQCVRDAAEIVSEVKELALRAEDARSIALTLFIARTKANGY